MKDALEKLIDARFLMALLVVGMFGRALAWDPGDATMKGALIAGFAGAWGYFLGSSKGAAESNARTDKVLDLAASGGAGQGKPDVVLKPGETAQAEEKG